MMKETSTQEVEITEGLKENKGSRITLVGLMAILFLWNHFYRANYFQQENFGYI